jgi:L-rhamnose isomerase
MDRLGHREILIESLDTLFRESLDPRCTLDSVEGKLFGPGTEAYVVGSHEFYLSYALTRGIMLTLDSGHFHPAENLADKISAILPYTGRLLLHVSRPVRWDSDHVVIPDAATRDLAREIVRADALSQVHLALDFFDPSVNRITAWIVGMRSTLKALLEALLEPYDLLLERELAGDNGDRLAIAQEVRTLPLAAVWDRFCLDNGVPPGADWLEHVHEYERHVLAARE